VVDGKNVKDINFFEPVTDSALLHALQTHTSTNSDEGVVGHGVTDAAGIRLARQPAMAVAVELQAEWRPGRHPR
jgi:hypothetical protein